MNRETPIVVRFYRTVAGNEPVRDLLQELPVADKKIAGADLMAVQMSWTIGKPLVDSLGDGIYEVRSTLTNRILRILFAQHEESLVLLHAFIKKTQACPQAEKQLAIKRLKEIITDEK